jgi:hypothetical protein
MHRLPKSPTVTSCTRQYHPVPVVTPCIYVSSNSRFFWVMILWHVLAKFRFQFVKFYSTILKQLCLGFGSLTDAGVLAQVKDVVVRVCDWQQYIGQLMHVGQLFKDEGDACAAMRTCTVSGGPKLVCTSCSPPSLWCTPRRSHTYAHVATMLESSMPLQSVVSQPLPPETTSRAHARTC